jgi:ADP-ribosylglycohydrolase/protein-tyrosine phosphatase
VFFDFLQEKKMLGAIIGDIVGSIYEFDNLRSTQFEFFGKNCSFTDDTVLTVALADAILNNKNYAQVMREYYDRYPDESYGGGFIDWAETEDAPAYNSWGNGAAMRISPVGYAFNSLEDVLKKAIQYTEVTHNHPEGIKGACATASAIFLARTGHSKQDIKNYIVTNFGYNLDRTCDEIRPTYKFNESCQGTVPEAIIAFLESTDFESAIRLAISLGGDSDTLACITGGIAQAFYKQIPSWIAQGTLARLDDNLREIVLQFHNKFYKTSYSSPMQIKELPVLNGVLGLSLCPGKKDVGWSGSIWCRDLDIDSQVIKDWGASVWLNLMEECDIKEVELTADMFRNKTAELGIDYIHFPIVDQEIPTSDTEQLWVEQIRPVLINKLANGEKIFIHCRGGLGRTGIIAARLLFDSGSNVPPTAEDLISVVRQARSPNAIETDIQENWVRSFYDTVLEK